jgi:hypothetical protein
VGITTDTRRSGKPRFYRDRVARAATGGVWAGLVRLEVRQLATRCVPYQMY